MKANNIVGRRAVSFVVGLGLVAALAPLATAHLDADGDGNGSEMPAGDSTSRGFQGVSRDMRHGTANAGVSGAYIGPSLVGAVECLNQGVLPIPNPTTAAIPGDFVTWATGIATSVTTRESCDGSATGTSMFFADGYGATGITLCDMEVLVGDVAGALQTDEEYVGSVHVPTTFGTSTVQMPDGVFDDGGLGGACHGRDIYSAPFDVYNDAVSCGAGAGASVAYAEDILLGDDVPILVSCDSGSQAIGGDPLCATNAVITNLPGLLDPATTVTAATNMVNELAGNPPPGGCVQEHIDDALETAGPIIADPVGFVTEFVGALLDQSPPPVPGTDITCDTDDSADNANLGKGGGLGATGVTYPGGLINTATSAECPGDAIVFVSVLVSANPFNDDVDPSQPGESATNDDFSWPVIGGGQLPGTAGGSGDVIVYVPVGGWIDYDST